MKSTINDGAEPERLEDIVVKKDNDVEEAVRIYHGLDFGYLRGRMLQSVQEIYQQKKIPVLTPAQIDIALQQIIQETPKERTNDSMTGRYITLLIQDSYTAGNNNFTLNSKDARIDRLAYNLAGTKKQPITLTINGNTGNNCGVYMEQSQITINGNTGDWCGADMNRSQVTINGNTGDYFGYRMNRSQVTINGTEGYHYLYYGGCDHIVIIYGNTGDWCGKYATNSTISTNKTKTYKKIKANISKGNTVILYDARRNIVEQYA